MTEIIDKDSQRGRESSITGFAHEHIALGILMKKYQNVSLVDLPLSQYDIIIALPNGDSVDSYIRAQIKTATNTISFTGGTRGGKDRTYKSGIKSYTQNTKTSDVVIGVHDCGADQFDLYFVPTIFIERLKQKSLSISKAKMLKNNYDILEKCKDENYVIEFCKKQNMLSI